MYIYIYTHIHTHVLTASSLVNVSIRLHVADAGIIRTPMEVRCYVVTYHVLDVSHETPDVTPCRTSPPMPFFRTHPPRQIIILSSTHYSTKYMLASIKRTVEIKLTVSINLTAKNSLIWSFGCLMCMQEKHPAVHCVQDRREQGLRLGLPKQ